MITAIILMTVDRTRIQATAEKLADYEGISEVYSVSGEFDLAAIARVRNNDELAELVTERLALVDAIEETHTMLAFRAYSRHDLETMFSLG
jgi:DNA-binding Lrp family transcriptional regulator